MHYLYMYLGQFSFDTQISNKSAIFPSGYNTRTRTRTNFTVGTCSSCNDFCCTGTFLNVLLVPMQ